MSFFTIERISTSTALVLLAASAHALDIHSYTVAVNESLTRMSVEARFSVPVTSVSARSRDAGQYVHDVTDCTDESRIRVSGRRLALADDGITCLRYSVDMGKAARDQRRRGVLADENVVLPPSVWLWRPAITASSNIDVHFQLPPAARVSVPWLPTSTEGVDFRISPSPQSSSAPAVFGKFLVTEIEVPGATLRINLLSTGKPVNEDAIVSWVQAAATDASLAYGRFPNPGAQIVVYPVGESRGRSDSPVPFGRVIRDGGETVELFVNENRSLADYLDDWTATHEFSHLMLPFLGRKHRWISEGFAQYYQNVLLTRSGAYDEMRAWQKIYDGLERGRKTRPELSPNEAAQDGVRNGLMKVYWSGAAIALKADVYLRQMSAGKESLDTVLEQFQACCLPGDRVWSGEEMFDRFDELTEYPIFMQLYDQYADVAGFPDTAEQFARLGISIANDRISIENNGELRAVRNAIMAPDHATSIWRQGLSDD